MATVGNDLDSKLVIEREEWKDGPPHELFAPAPGVPRALERAHP